MELASIYKCAPYQWQALIRRKGFETQAKVFNPKVEAESWAKVTESEMVRGELASLTWDTVYLNKQILILPETKNGGKRVVPLSRAAVQILSGMPSRLDGKVFGFADSHSITTAFNRSLSRARVAYEKECEEKGEKPDPNFLTGITFHDLRHEATSHFFEMGFNVMEVSAITGHKTLQILKRYTHLKAEDLAKRLK